MASVLTGLVDCRVATISGFHSKTWFKTKVVLELLEDEEPASPLPITPGNGGSTNTAID